MRKLVNSYPSEGERLIEVYPLHPAAGELKYTLLTPFGSSTFWKGVIQWLIENGDPASKHGAFVSLGQELLNVPLLVLVIVDFGAPV